MVQNEGLIEDTKFGDHLCCFYKNKEEQFSVLVSFFANGLKNNELCRYVIDESTPELVIEEFKKRGLNIEPYIRSGQFIIRNKNDFYLKDGIFNPERTLNLIKLSEKEAIEKGYSGLRGAGESSWALRNESDKKLLIQYEAQINEVLPRMNAVLLCLYDETKFESGVLIEAVHTHPFVILESKMCENKYYFNPFLAEGPHQKLPESAYSMIIYDLINGD